MLFNSYEFIFVLLPVALMGFFAIGARGNRRHAVAWLVGVSLFFYGWWNPTYLALIIGSILFNFTVGVALTSGRSRGKLILTAGVLVNLGLLAYFKYANFFVDNVNQISGTDFHLTEIILPLAISFFTFQQITYLVDAFKGETKEYSFLHYCLFVTFFPQLIAGPIVHHKEMLPQFEKETLYQFSNRDMSVGLTIFVIGLFKKVVFADGVALYATTLFSHADSGAELSTAGAWVGALAYTFQLYFDFSGYSDMAIGIARMFGVRLPLNFNSPYRATSIIEFWRRWHMTLSRFLRDYLYIPLGGNRKGRVRRQTNLMITMVLGGLWHGAGWNFVIWGAIHGVSLMINHAFRTVLRGRGGRARAVFGWGLTFVAVVFAWVPFRATTLDGALSMWAAMLGLEGSVLPAGASPAVSEIPLGWWAEALAWIGALFVIAVALPNTQQILRAHKPTDETSSGEIAPLRWAALEWAPSKVSVAVVTGAFLYAAMSMSEVSEFLYFNF